MRPVNARCGVFVLLCSFCQIHASRTDDRACADGHTTADGGVGTDPDVVLQRDGRGGADAVAALLWINRVSGTGQTDARRDKGSRADMNRRRVQNHAVIVDHRQPVDVDIEAVVAAKIGLDIGQRVVGAQKLTQDGAALLRVLRGCLVICPTKLAWHVFVPPLGHSHTRRHMPRDASSGRLGS